MATNRINGSNLHFGLTYEVSSIKVHEYPGSKHPIDKTTDPDIWAEAGDILIHLCVYRNGLERPEPTKHQAFWDRIADVYKAADEKLEGLGREDKDYGSLKQPFLRNGKNYLVLGFDEKLALFQIRQAISQLSTPLFTPYAQRLQSDLKKYQDELNSIVEREYFSSKQISDKKIEVELTAPADPVKNHPYVLSGLNIVG